MGFRKDIKEIKETVDKINNSIAKDTLQKLSKLEELEKNLSHISFKVKNIVEKYEEDGNKSLKIEYIVEPIKLVFDANGEMFFDNKFYSINMLNLISFDDMNKIQKAINKISKENGKK